MTELLYRSPDSTAEVWLGDCLDPESVAAIMGDRKADALIVDAPYSERTHGGHDAGLMTPAQIARWVRNGSVTQTGRKKSDSRRRNAIEYNPWAREEVEQFLDLWSPLTAGWLCSLTDSELAATWRASFEANGRVTFAPLPFIETGSRVRLCGDGPSSWTCWLMVARPRGVPWSKWGALRGAYVMPSSRSGTGVASGDRITGGKPLSGMLAIVGDYSRHGDLVVDPCCGAGTTGVAARTLGRRFIGIDSNREHAEIAVRRIGEAREQITMPEVAPREEHQTTMFAADGE